jgi:hypothetical protein
MRAMGSSCRKYEHPLAQTKPSVGAAHPAMDDYAAPRLFNDHSAASHRRQIKQCARSCNSPFANLDKTYSFL